MVYYFLKGKIMQARAAQPPNEWRQEIRKRAFEARNDPTVLFERAY